MLIKFKNYIKFFIILFVVIYATSFSYASTTDGTIDPANHTALLCSDDLCTITSQVNFLTTTGVAVHITDSAVTGNAWSENVGWINFNPAQSGVMNTSAGVLSGYAWGENSGWINFKPSTGGVTIDSNGQFVGWAWAQNFGWIQFNCSVANACVQTDWRPTTTTKTYGYKKPPVIPTTPIVAPVVPFVPKPAPIVPVKAPAPTYPPAEPTTPIPDYPAPVVEEQIVETPEPEVIPTPVVDDSFDIMKYILLALPLHLLILFLFSLIIRKRKVQWGIVYDSITKQPLDGVGVSVYDLFGNQIAVTTTDVYGRYGFVVPNGSYKIFVRESDYVFPSAKLSGMNMDNPYGDLYFNEVINVSKKEIIAKNIPLDSVTPSASAGFNAIKLYSKKIPGVIILLNVMFYIGFALAITFSVVAPLLFNFLIASLYFVLLVLSILISRYRAIGRITY